MLNYSILEIFAINSMKLDVPKIFIVKTYFYHFGVYNVTRKLMLLIIVDMDWGH